MARIVIKTAQRPYKIMTTEGEKKICMCGLSKNLPFCDESHHKTDDENPDLLYQYDETGKRSALEEEDDEDCCGGGCCGGCEDKECGDKECEEDCQCNCGEKCECGEACKCEEKCSCDEKCGCGKNCSCGEACKLNSEDCEGCGDKCCSEDEKEGESCCCGGHCGCEAESEVIEKTKPEKHTHSHTK